MTNHVTNRLLSPLLRGPLGRVFGRRLALLRYRGRRTGRMRELVVQYELRDAQVWITIGRPAVPPRPGPGAGRRVDEPALTRTAGQRGRPGRPRYAVERVSSGVPNQPQ